MNWIRDRGLTLALLGLFVASLLGQLMFGWSEYNQTHVEHSEPAVDFAGYMTSGHPWEAIFENWESEFLQMAVFVLLTTVLVQRGSPESRAGGGIVEDVDVDPRDFRDLRELATSARS